jgi:DNA-binding CsgD family transcriptional regulator
VTRQRLCGLKRDVNREKSLDGSAKFAARWQEAPGSTPSEKANAKETWDQMVQRETALYKRVLELLGQGHTYDEIAELLGKNPKTVQRYVRGLHRRYGS